MKILQQIFGDKSTRDIREIMPILQKIKEAYEGISQLTNDELRAKTIEFREKIAGHIAQEEEQIKEIKKQIEAEEDIMEGRGIVGRCDKLEKESYGKARRY